MKNPEAQRGMDRAGFKITSRRIPQEYAANPPRRSARTGWRNQVIIAIRLKRAPEGAASNVIAPLLQTIFFGRRKLRRLGEARQSALR
jgi:hypothetical protein